MHLWGLTSDAEYKAFLNEGVCGATNGYLYRDNKGDEGVQPIIEADAYGMGMAQVIMPYAVRETSLSLAIQTTGMSKLVAWI